MVDVLVLLWSALTNLFRSRVRLEAEILVLQQQINVLRRKFSKKSVFSNFDRLAFVGLYCPVPGIVNALRHRIESLVARNFPRRPLFVRLPDLDDDFVIQASWRRQLQ